MQFDLVCGTFFLIDGARTLTAFECYRIYCFHTTAYVSHYERFTALHKLISIVLQLTNQVKISRVIMGCQGYFLKIALERLVLNVSVT